MPFYKNIPLSSTSQKGKLNILDVIVIGLLVIPKTNSNQLKIHDITGVVAVLVFIAIGAMLLIGYIDLVSNTRREKNKEAASLPLVKILTLKHSQAIYNVPIHSNNY